MNKRSYTKLFSTNLNALCVLNPVNQSIDDLSIVKVVVSGVRLIYPTSYVLVTDLDNHGLPEPSSREPLYTYQVIYPLLRGETG